MTPKRIVAVSVGVALVGLAILGRGFWTDPRRAWAAYLHAWTFGATVCVGALFLLMIGHAAKASWMIVTRRLTESVVDALPLYLLLFLPICVVLGTVYPWAAPEETWSPALRAAVEDKRGYLNTPFFIVRTLAYFAVFVAVGSLLRAWSKENDEAPRASLVRRMRGLSGAALPVASLAFTGAAFDWTMSLEPDWSSTIFGLYYFAGGFAGAIALVSVLLGVSALRGPSRVHITPDHAQALGRLLFAMVIFWAYMAFSQLLIYWIADIPEEVSYYLHRTTGGWSAVTVLLVCGMFIAPFFALLNRHWKRRPGYLAAVGAWVFVMHYVDVFWMVVPAYGPVGFRLRSFDLGSILFVGGASCAWMAHRYFGAAPLPRHLPNLSEGLDYEAAL